MPISLEQPKNGTRGENKKALLLGILLLILGIWGGSFVMYDLLPPEHWAQKPVLATTGVILFLAAGRIIAWRRSWHEERIEQFNRRFKKETQHDSHQTN